MIYVLAVVVTLGLSIWLHEAAHGGSAILLGGRVTRLVLGRGPVIWRCAVKGAAVELRLFPVSGHCFFHTRPGATRLRDMLIATAAGPLENIVLIAMALPFWSTPLGLMVAGVNMLLLVANTVRADVKVEDGARATTDGLRVWRLIQAIKSRNSWSERWLSFQAAEFQDIVRSARRIASERGDVGVQPVHIFTALWDHPTALASALVRDAGVQRPFAEPSADAPATGRHSHVPLPPSEGARDLVERAMALTADPPFQTATALHVLLAIVEGGDDSAAELSRCGIDRAFVASVLDEWLPMAADMARAMEAVAERKYPEAVQLLVRVSEWRILPPRSRAEVLN